MKIPYRSDIDGIRAIAVLSVLFYHADLQFGQYQLFQGGYLGVDAFFVISGYLITKTLVNEHQLNGSFSFINFYERRARRLLPLLFVVIILSAIFSKIYQYPSEYSNFLSSVPGAVFFYSNFFWFFSDQAYNDQIAAQQPLLHTWSLAVEEQFYLIYPVILLLIISSYKKYKLVLFLIVSIASFAFACLMTRSDPSFAFYLLPTRFWELACGACLVLCKPNLKWKHQAVLPPIGLALILFSVFLLPYNPDFHPGILTLPVVIGTVLLIHFNKAGERVHSFLSLKPMVVIGLISYTLYLVHYPAFAFATSGEEFGSYSEKFRVILYVFLISGAIYALIERPILKRKVFANRTLFNSMCVSTSMLLPVLAIFVLPLFNQKIVSVDIAAEMAKRVDWKGMNYNVCRQIAANDCAKLKDRARKTVLVVGDSMAPDALRIIARQFPDHNYILSSSGWCIPVRNELKRVGSKSPLDECKSINQTRFDPTSLNGIDGVVLISRYYDGETFSHGKPSLQEYVKFLTENGQNNIIVLGNYVRVKPAVDDLYLRLGGDEKRILSAIKIDKSHSDLEVSKLAEEHSISFISLQDTACSEGNCPIFFDGVPFSWDRHHFTAEFTDYLSDRLKDRLSGSWLSGSE